MTSQPEYIYKITPGSPTAPPPAHIADPSTPSDTPVFVPSSLDISSGFMHMSTASQVPGTLKAFFVTRGDRRDSVWLVRVKLRDVQGSVRWEGPAEPGGEEDGARIGEGLFPHLYFEGEEEGEKVRLWLKVGEVEGVREVVVPVGQGDGWEDALRGVQGWLV